MWEPLSADARRDLAAWLDGINHVFPATCIWLGFRVLTNVALRGVGARHDPDRLAADLVNLERQYLADRWYGDGIEGQRDYYVSFGMHYDLLLYARLAEDRDPDLARLVRGRAARFAADLILWHAADGSMLPYGRSLTYRFAQASLWPAAAFAKVDGLPSPGVLKGLVLRHLRWWFRQPICTDGGLLTIGYAYPNLHLAENYNAPGRPTGP